MTRILTSLTLCGALFSVLALALRYLIPVWPAPGVDLASVNFRLMLVQSGSALVALGAAAMLAWKSPDRRARLRVSTLVFSVGLLLVVSWFGYSVHTAPAPQSTEGGPYRFTTDWVSRHTDLWTRVLGHLKDRPGIHGLEIGSFEGRSTIWFLDNVLTHPKSTITCIDVWTYVGDPLAGDSDEKTFDGNIAAHGQGQRVVKLKG